MECKYRTRLSRREKVVEMMLNLFKEYKLVFIATFSSLFLLFLYASFYPNMDEAIHHHVLACSKYPLSVLHIYREDCAGGYDLKLFGTWLPIRTYIYSGGLLSYILFNPLHAILNHYTVLFLYQFLLFCGIVFFTHKLLKVNIGLILAVFSTCFPFYYQIIHDTGPVAYHILTFVLFPYLILKTSLSSSYIKKSLYLILSGIILFLAIEQKPFYLVLIPIPYLFTLLYFYHEKRIDKQLFVYFTISGIITLLLTAILLSAELRDGSKYFTVITGMDHNSTSIFINRFLKYIGYLASFPKFTHRIFYISNNILDVFVSLFYWFVLFFIVRSSFRINPSTIYSKYLKLLFLLFLVSSLLVCYPKAVWAGHHFVFPIFFLLLIFILALNELKQSFKTIVSIIIISFSISMYSILAHKNLLLLNLDKTYGSYEATDISKQRILQSVLTTQLQSKNIVVHIDWGTYYIDALFGPKEQIVMFVDLNRDNYLQVLNDIQKKAKEQSRGIIFIGLASNEAVWSLIKTVFSSGRYLEEPKQQAWVAYQGM